MSGGGRFQWDVNKIPSTPVKTEKTAQPSGESNLLKLCALDSGHLSNQFCGGVIGTKTSGGKMCINQHCNVAKHKVTKPPSRQVPTYTYQHQQMIPIRELCIWNQVYLQATYHLTCIIFLCHTSKLRRRGNCC